MSIVASNPPVAAITAVYSALVDRLERAAFSPSNLQRANPYALSMAFPHRVMYLPTERLRPDLNLREAVEFHCWRFLIHEKQQHAARDGMIKGQKDLYRPIAAATTRIANDGRYELSDLAEGPLVIGTEDTVRRAESYAQTQKHDFEASLLVAPGFVSAAIWLQAGNPTDDLLLDIDLGAAIVEVPQTPTEFVQHLYGLSDNFYPV